MNGGAKQFKRAAAMLAAVFVAFVSQSSAGEEALPAMVTSLASARVGANADPAKAAIVKEYLAAYYSGRNAARYLVGLAYKNRTGHHLPEKTCSVTGLDNFIILPVVRKSTYVNEKQIAIEGKCPDGKKFSIGFFLHNGRIEEIVDMVSAPTIPSFGH